MRATLLLGIASVVALATVVAPAHAEEEFELKVTGGQVTLTAHTPWHVNKEYPWKLQIGAEKLDKTKFTLTESTATVSGAPKGTGVLKGAVCSNDGQTCKPFSKEVTVQ